MSRNVTERRLCRHAAEYNELAGHGDVLSAARELGEIYDALPELRLDERSAWLQFVYARRPTIPVADETQALAARQAAHIRHLSEYCGNLLPEEADHLMFLRDELRLVQQLYTGAFGIPMELGLQEADARIRNRLGGRLIKGAAARYFHRTYLRGRRAR
jgi:hypothetical protein